MSDHIPQELPIEDVQALYRQNAEILCARILSQRFPKARQTVLLESALALSILFHAYKVSEFTALLDLTSLLNERGACWDMKRPLGSLNPLVSLQTPPEEGS